MSENPSENPAVPHNRTSHGSHGSGNRRNGSSPPPGDPDLPKSPAKSYSQAAMSGSRVLEEKFSNVIRYSPVADLQGGVASVDLPEELLSDSKPLWSAYIVGHFMGDAPHIGKVHAIVNRIWSFPDRPAKIDAQFISPRTVLFRIDHPQLKERVLKRTFWHIADIPIVVREWSPKTASAQPDLTAVPLWVDLQGVPDHLFSHNGLTFFGDTIGHTVKLHPNTERCVRLDVARLLVVMNLEEPLPASINVRGSGEVISVSYPWLPPRCLGCQKWGHTDKTCSKNKHVKDKTEVEKENEKVAESTGTEGLQAGLAVITENSKPIDIENPVLEVAPLATAAASAHESSTNDSEGKVKDTEVIVRDSVSGKAAEDIEISEKEEPWLTIPQSSPSGKRNNGKSGRGTEIELTSTSSPSRFHLLSTDLEEGEVEVEEVVEEDSSSSDEESSVESKAVMEKKKQIEKQKLGNNKRNQKSNPSVNVGNKKDQTKGAKNKKANHVSSRRH
ncbi:hypothetical protein IGI04_040729 [Brassica rapa subsp. trilocularis]|uniref:DUF4283 domain-containing protein n=1 Tax=Brassica rapa subsp. trilocularis TaxID=1813537 RepID=A0ABQ7KNQ5_BRACM|nr:hypothetical protein IGI04_040729 [Brassica rapa subsp. trilocularis]